VLRPGQRREAVLAAWGFGEDGREVLLGLMEGSKEDVEAVRAFGDSLLVVSDGVSGIIRAIADCFPRSAGQRCLAHRIATSPPRVPTDLWPEFKTRQRLLPGAVAGDRSVLAADVRADCANLRRAGPVIPVPCFQHGSGPTAF
jgi:transposase-like protein